MQNETNPVSHRWANIPGLDNKAQVSASRAQGRIKGMLREQKADIALIRLENLKIPPRRSVVTYWSYRDNSYAQIGARPDDCQNVVEMDVGLDMVPIAIDLYRRWPEKERPQSIVLLSDGQTLLFNPGRPESDPSEILRTHLDAIAPAAMLLGVKGNRHSHINTVFGA